MKPTTRELFVKEYSPYINAITKDTGILPGTLIAQSILESSGKWNTGEKWLVGGSKLSQVANNFFGIKADKSWKGKRYNIKTGENKPSGEYYIIADDFRRYDSVEDSIKDYISFLKNNPRYTTSGVFKAKTVKEQAEALKRGGYATAPNYAEMVNSVYESVKNFISQNAKIVTGSGLILFLGLFLAYKYFK